MEDTPLTLTDRVDKLDKDKGVSHAYSTKDLNPNPSVVNASTIEAVYGMPPNYYTGQSPPPSTVRPSGAKPLQPAASAGQTSDMAVGPVRWMPWCWPR